MENAAQERRMNVFTVIWLGQLISLVGTGLTGFALGIWVFQRTGSVTQFALISLFTILPSILISPLAGALVDRWDRRKVMIFSDLAAGTSTLITTLLLFGGRLEIWHIYALVSLGSLAGAFRMPAYMALTALTVPRKQMGRASGMMQVAPAASQVVAPILAAVLIAKIGMEGVVLVDFATFLVAVVTLLFVKVPKPPAAGAKRQSIWSEALHGWRYIGARPGLLWLLLFLALINVTYGFAQVLFTPMILSFADSKTLGTVLSVGATGFLAGSILASVWGGPARKINGVLGFSLLYGGCLVLAGARQSVPLISAALFGLVFCLPLINACNQAIWMSKTAPEFHGRVFATRTMISWSAGPLAFLLAGPLADKVFEPLLARGGPLAASAGAFTGTGPGRGIGFFFMLIGLLAVLVVPLVGYMNRRVRYIEDELPDAVPAQGAPAVA
jgi:MFS family permease